MRKYFAYLFCSLSFFITLKAQDIFFSQYFLNSLNSNPAVAGSANDPRIFLQYRNQWPSLGNAFVTYQGSYDQYIKSINSGIGLNIFRDNQGGGTITSTDVDLIYSYRTKINSSLTIQSGLQASFLFNTINVGDFENIGTRQTTQPDVAIGFLGMTRYSQIGLSIYHLNSGIIRFNYNFVTSPVKYSLFYSRKIKIYDPDKVQENGFFLTPSFNVNMQGQSVMINYGAAVEKGNIFGGMWFRNNIPFQFSAIVFSVGFIFNNLRVCYSYDYSVMSLNNVTPVTGAHEISLVMTIPTDPKSERYNPVKCPKPLNK